MAEEGDAMTFVADWVGGRHEELGATSLYNDLSNLFRTKYGRNALGLRNALQHYVKLGLIEGSKGSYSSQTYSIVGMDDDGGGGDGEDALQEGFMNNPVEDNVAPVVQVAAATSPVDQQPAAANDTKYPLLA